MKWTTSLTTLLIMFCWQFSIARQTSFDDSNWPPKDDQLPKNSISSPDGNKVLQLKNKNSNSTFQSKNLQGDITAPNNFGQGQVNPSNNSSNDYAERLDNVATMMCSCNNMQLDKAANCFQNAMTQLTSLQKELSALPQETVLPDSMKSSAEKMKTCMQSFSNKVKSLTGGGGL